MEKAVIIPIESALEGMQGVRFDRVAEARSGNGRVRVMAKDGTESERTAGGGQNPGFPHHHLSRRKSNRRTSNIPDSNMWFDVIKIAVVGEMDEVDLLRAARRVRDDLIEMPGISQVAILGVSPMEISIEADPMRLRDFGLTFADLSAAIQRSSLDLPAGQIQTDEGSLMIRSKGQAYVRGDFENIVIRNRDGAEVSLGKVAQISDGFEENRKILRFNGKPCLLIEALRLNDENALEIADAVKKYAATERERFPEGITLHIWDDSSEELRGPARHLVRQVCSRAACWS